MASIRSTCINRLAFRLPPTLPRDPPMLAARLKSVFNQFGVREGLYYLAAKALSAASRGHITFIRYHFVAQPIPETSTPGNRTSAKSTVRIVSPGDPVVASFPRPAEVIANRFANGSTCFVAETNGRFSGFLWLAHGAYEEDEVRCRYVLADPSRCAWDYDVYVEPDFRIGRTFSRLWEAANTHLASEGVRWSLSRISAFNPASLAAHRRLGIRKVATASFLKCGRVQLSALDRRPYLHLSLSARRPVLRLSPPH